MALVLEVILGLVIVASFVVAYMSARTWPIYQVILAEFVFLGAVAFFNLGALTLATHRAWRTLVQQREAELATVEKQKQEIVEGGGQDPNGQPSKGIKQLKDDLFKLAVDRGGVLYDAAVEGVKDGVVQLTLKSPNHGLSANDVLFAFDQGPFEEGGRYRGEFKVASVGENGAVQITPNLPLTDAQTQQLGAVKGAWTLYTTMPVDDAALFAKLDEKSRQALLSGESMAEFSNTERPLRDYEYLFHESYVQRSLLADAIAKVKSDLDRTTAAVTEANTEIGYRTTEKTKLAADLERFQFERKAIADYQKSLESLFQQVRESLKATFNTNRQLAAELTAAQLRAADEINQRGRVPAVGPPLTLRAPRP